MIGLDSALCCSTENNNKNNKKIYVLLLFSQSRQRFIRFLEIYIFRCLRTSRQTVLYQHYFHVLKVKCSFFSLEAVSLLIRECSYYRVAWYLFFSFKFIIISVDNTRKWNGSGKTTKMFFSQWHMYYSISKLIHEIYTYVSWIFSSVFLVLFLYAKQPIKSLLLYMLLILMMTSSWVEINQLWLFCKFFNRRVQFLLWRKHRLLYGINQSFFHLIIASYVP